jgi:hypothetical protein
MCALVRGLRHARAVFAKYCGALWPVSVSGRRAELAIAGRREPLVGRCGNPTDFVAFARFRARRSSRAARSLFLYGRPVAVDGGADDARFVFVDVVLRKLGKGARAVAGRLVRAPRKGSVVVIEFPDGMHEYVTTPVKRVLRIAGREIFYIETINSRYRLEVRGRETAAVEGTG